MDSAQRAERLKKIVRDNQVTEELTDKTTHLERHAPKRMPEDYGDYALVGDDDTPLVYGLGRLISDATESNEIGYFATKAGMERALDAHIMEQAMTVAALFSGRSKKLDVTSDTKVWSHGQDIGGYSLQKDPKTGAIREVRANATKLVMRQSPFDPNGIGMRIVTFFPTTDNVATAYGTGRDLRDALRKTKEYRESTPLGRTFLERCCDPEATHPEVENQYVPYADMVTMSLPNSKAVLACRAQKSRMIVEVLGTKRGTIRLAPNPDAMGETLIKAMNERYSSQMRAMSDIKDRFDVPYDPTYDKSPTSGLPKIDPYPKAANDEFGM